MNFSQLAKLQALKKHLENFRNNHPRFEPFVNAVSREALREGAVIEINVTSPEGKNYVTNMKLNNEDIEFLKALQALNTLADKS